MLVFHYSLGEVGAAAVGAFLDRGADTARAQNNQVYYYWDSFGDVVPVDPEVIARGVYPPPLPAGLQPARGGKIHPDQSTSANCTAGSSTYYSNTSPPNILLLMVDQMRAPRWLPQGYMTPPVSVQPLAGQAIAGWQSFLAAYLPNLSNLYNHSFVFNNYFTAAVQCTPARATVQTGLYSQQTCIFQGDSPTMVKGTPYYAPGLIPYAQDGFPTIGDVLSQSLPAGSPTSSTKIKYNTVWIGKWHLSASSGDFNNGNPGSTGPGEYGYDPNWSIPGTNPAGNYPTPRGRGYPSPNGFVNAGSAGHFIDGSLLQTQTNHIPGQPSYAQLSPPLPCQVGPGGTCSNPPFPQPPQAPANECLLSDTGILEAFQLWLTRSGTGPATPWFAGVSFINPHDIVGFPVDFALAGNSPDFGFPGQQRGAPTGFLPPPTTGYVCSYSATGPSCAENPYEAVSLYPLNPAGAPYTASYDPLIPASLPQYFSDTDNPANLYYTTQQNNGQFGKPGLQYYFQSQIDNGFGSVNTEHGWVILIQYYFTLLYNVDNLIGQVVKSVDAASPHTWIIFTSDHGEFGGSHWLHDKGGAVYDECINVPLYVSNTKMRQNPDSAPLMRNFVCSSVDILPLIYSLALGNNTWRTNCNDIINYLSGREAIVDAIHQSEPKQRRLSQIPNSQTNQFNGQTTQPYILHTYDEYFTASIPDPNGKPVQVPTHAIAFRTVDVTLITNSGTTDYTYPYGGGKLGIYNWWNAMVSCNASNPTQPVTPSLTVPLYPQYEFYTYPTNYAETGNEAIASGRYRHPAFSQDSRRSIPEIRRLTLTRSTR